MLGSNERIEVPCGHSIRVLRWDRSLREVYCAVAPGRTTRIRGEGNHWHFHTEMELTVFTSGEGTRCVGDHVGQFTAGDLVLLGEKLPHYWHTRGGASGVSVQWHFPDSHPFWAFPETVELAELFKDAGRGLRLTGSTASAVAGLLLEIPHECPLAQLARLMIILAKTATAPAADRDYLSSRPFNLTAESHHQQAISKALRHLVANFRDQVSLGDLLVITDLSRPTFARQFRQHSGRSFSEFLNRLRLDAACRELASSERNVIDIALTSGFSEISFFNRLFRREMNCTPSEYRNKCRSGKENSNASAETDG